MEEETKSSEEPTVPVADASGYIKTLNSMGFMTPESFLDSFALEFIDYSQSCTLPVLDIGCAYGSVSRAALEKGAKCVIANDIDPRHLQLLSQSVEVKPYSKNIVFKSGRFPSELDFEADSIEAVFISRVLHFFDGPTIRICLEKIHNWLMPGRGKLFIVAETPHQRKSFLSTYKKRKKDKEEWPGYLNSGVKGAVGGGSIHFLDKDILKRELKVAGFKVERGSYFGRHAQKDENEETKKDSVGIVAGKKKSKRIQKEAKT